jgi:methylmalonyl-CoA mutase C-terminal domain/subunit
MIVEAVIQEDVDVVGLSVLSGAHTTLFPRIVRLLSEKGVDDVLLLAGGIIPAADVPGLEQLGFACIFGPGTATGEVVDFIRAHVRKQS